MAAAAWNDVHTGPVSELKGSRHVVGGYAADDHFRADVVMAGHRGLVGLLVAGRTGLDHLAGQQFTQLGGSHDEQGTGLRDHEG